LWEQGKRTKRQKDKRTKGAKNDSNRTYTYLGSVASFLVAARSQNVGLKGRRHPFNAKAWNAYSARSDLLVSKKRDSFVDWWRPSFESSETLGTPRLSNVS
jgi:hypothetical protein